MQDSRDITCLRADPDNAAIFDALAGADLQELADSIREHGIINPISIRPDGRIIAGEQRWRAAQLAGVQQVPVVVRDVSDEQVEVLRIEENLRRRVLKTSETARAIRRLYELRDVKRGGDGGDSKITQDNLRTPQEEVAGETGYTPAQVSRLNTIADLIPSLAALLDAGQITQKVAYQLAQLPAEDQAAVVALGTVQNHSDQEVKALKERLREVQAQAQERFRTLKIELQDMEENKALEIGTLRLAKDTEIARLLKAQTAPPHTEAPTPPAVASSAPEESETRRQLERWRNGEKDFERKYHLSRLINPLRELASHDLDELQTDVEDMPDIAYFGDHKFILDTVLPWLQEYARMLGERTGRPNKIRSVK